MDVHYVFFFKQKTAYEMRISDWSSDVCSSDLDVLDDTIWTRQGRRQFGVELKIVDEKGQELPSDGESAGSVLVRGPWVIERYYLSDASALEDRKSVV